MPVPSLAAVRPTTPETMQHYEQRMLAKVIAEYQDFELIFLYTQVTSAHVVSSVVIGHGDHLNTLHTFSHARTGLGPENKCRHAPVVL